MSSKVRVWILASFIGVALVQSWPLPLHLTTRLTGQITGDTGVYVWNLWVFRHELIGHHAGPFWTTTILPLDGPTDLSLHNYTVFADLLAVPLLPLFGVVATFNLVYLINVALCGIGLFLLARRVYDSSEAGTAEVWLAGALFACSPFLVARSTAHFSLAAAAPLPFFVWALDRAWQTQRVRDAAMAGACVAWAAFSDPYYGIYCAMLGVIVGAARLVGVEATRRWTPRSWARTTLDVVIAAGVCVVVAARASESPTIHIGDWSLTLRSLYTPVLVLTTLAVARMLMGIRTRLSWRPLPRPTFKRLVAAGVLAVAVAALLLAPEICAIVVRAAEGRMVTPPVLWRSSAPGIDAVSLVLPNPNHTLAPRAMVRWLAHEPGQFEENVASIPWTVLLVIAAAWRWARYRPRRLWMGLAVFFALLTLGPFIRVAGITTYVPTPWTLLRYVPIVGEARMPARFGVIVIMAVSVLFAGAVGALVRRYPERRRALLFGIGLALAFEVLPVPRTLYSAEVPDVYQRVAADSRPVRLLELPFGIRDGLSSLGDFNAASQFFQTRHEKALIGGYLSRVEDPSKAYYRSLPVIDALLSLSEGKTLTGDQAARARDTAQAFLAQAQVGYVVMDNSRVPEALRQFAIDTLGLVKIDEGQGYELYTPQP